MKMVSMYMPEDLRQRLREESERTGAPMSELVRRAIDEYLRDREKQPKKATTAAR